MEIQRMYFECRRAHRLNGSFVVYEGRGDCKYKLDFPGHFLWLETLLVRKEVENLFARSTLTPDRPKGTFKSMQIKFLKEGSSFWFSIGISPTIALRDFHSVNALVVAEKLEGVVRSLVS